MAEHLIRSETLDAIADAINAKTGGTDAMTPAEMVAVVAVFRRYTMICEPEGQVAASKLRVKSCAFVPIDAEPLATIVP